MNLNKLLTALRHRQNAPARAQQAERGERYTHALEQFLDGQPAVRLGGAYTLTNLADEWLADTSLPEQVRREEAQTIIDALTGCIRTPYPLAQKRQILEADETPEGYEGDFTRDQEALREEQLVRRTVFMEFSRRLAAAAKSNKEGNGESQHTVPLISPMWADLRFDFSGAPIFYPLRQLHFQNADFASATFYGPADFFGATFHGDTSFSAAQFTADASFQGANFNDWVGFSAAHFAGAAEFSGASFEGAYFADATFGHGADFRQTSFMYVKPSFEALERRLQRARFSAQADPQDYLFEARPESPHGFSCGEAELLNRTFVLPLGAVLYDPDSWDEEKQEYTRFSEPAQ